MMMMAMNSEQTGEGAAGDQQEQLKCPRCESTNTKFCYYNNYNLSQPRHFCKSCRRYWTVGGALRNIPFGGGIRKPNRASPTTSTTSKRVTKPAQPATPTSGNKTDVEQQRAAAVGDASVIPCNFSSLLANDGQLGIGFADSMFSGGGTPPSVQFGDQFSAEAGGFNGDMEMGEVGCWGGVNGWSDLALYPPGLSFDQ